MSTAGGPKAVTNGLVYAVDAGNNNSFKGESTTNLATNPHSLTTNYASSAVGSNGTNLNFTGEFNAGTVTGPGWFARTGTGGNGTNGVRYTTSWYLKAGTLSTVSVDWGGSHQGNITTFVANLRTGTVSSVSLAAGESYGIERMPNDFWRVWYSSTLTTGTAYYPQMTLGSGNIIVGGIQIEQKSYPTRFVNGSRGTTVEAGGGLADMSGNSNHGELINGAREGTGFLLLDGTNDYVSIQNSTSLQVGETFSVNSWVYPTNLSNRFGIFSTRFDNTAGSWQLEVGTANSGTGRIAVTGVGTWVWESSNDVITTNNWYNICYVKPNNATQGGTMYLNGVVINPSVTTAYTVLNNSSIKVVGSGTWNNQFFPGNISQVSLYNRALTASEVLQNYNAHRRRYS